MASASKFVVVWQKDGRIVAVYGNRHGEPFTSKANAQRSLTRRKGKRNMKDQLWTIREILK